MFESLETREIVRREIARLGMTEAGVALVQAEDADAQRAALGITAAGDALLQAANAADQRVALEISSAGDALLTANDTASQLDLLGASPVQSERHVPWFDDFDRQTPADSGWTTSNTGANSSVYVETTHITSAEAALGEFGITFGTEATGRACLYRTASSILLGTHAIDLEFRATCGTAASVSDDYVVQFGLIDNPTANAEPTNGVYFAYRRATDGDYWVCVSRDNGDETKTVTSVVAAAASALKTFRIQVIESGLAATFWIDGAIVGTHATHIPIAAGRRVGIAFKAYKTAGTTQRWHYVDYCKFLATRGSAR